MGSRVEYVRIRPFPGTACPGPDDYLREIAETMREGDRAECAPWPTPLDALRWSVEQSEAAFVALYRGRPMAAWGVRSWGVATGSAALWLLTTSEVERHPRVFLRACRAWLHEYRTVYAALYARVGADYPRAVRWLRREGFEVGPDGAVTWRRVPNMAGSVPHNGGDRTLSVDLRVLDGAA